MAVERKNVVLTDGQDGAGLLWKLECADTPPAGKIVHCQAARTEAGLVAGITEFLRVLRFSRRAHHDAIVVEPTGGGLFCQAHIARIWRHHIATVDVARICEGTHYIETRHDAPGVPRPASSTAVSCAGWPLGV